MSPLEYAMARSEHPPPQLIDGYPRINPDFYEAVFGNWQPKEQNRLRWRADLSEQLVAFLPPAERLRLIERTWPLEGEEP